MGVVGTYLYALELSYSEIRYKNKPLLTTVALHKNLDMIEMIGKCET